MWLGSRALSECELVGITPARLMAGHVEDRGPIWAMLHEV
jgi:hypothetical protein